MKPIQIIKEMIMKPQGIKSVTLANRLGIDQRVLSMRFQQENISVDKLNEMLRALDYKIVIMPRDTREQEGWFRVE